ncbi:phosphoglycerate mutase family protein [Ponticoccus litoralis]|uniref:Phosphoglycerate mutase family protein n=1 Tax=Ponticoccus litoralis TaxID=422297 RepID=A0AAW9SJL7_9RHOB
MSFITLVRHGQANSASRDEAGYDKLSPLGWEQGRWLGGYFRQAGERFARVYTGTLRRHVETAEAIAADCATAPMRDERLNELTYFHMAQMLEEQHAIAMPADREAFVRHLPVLFAHWRDEPDRGRARDLRGLRDPAPARCWKRSPQARAARWW